MRHWLRRYREEGTGRRGATKPQQQCLNQNQQHQQHQNREKLRLNQTTNPKKRLLMKSASSMARCSGQRKEKRSIPDDESRMRVEDMWEMGTGEKTSMRIASVEQVEMGNITGVVNHGSCGKNGQDNRTSLGGLSLRKRRWVELEESQPPDSCQTPA